jgi:hypothetical protein
VSRCSLAWGSEAKPAAYVVYLETRQSTVKPLGTIAPDVGLHNEKFTCPAEVNALRIRRPSVTGAGKLAYDHLIESVPATFAADAVTVVAQDPEAIDVFPRVEVPLATNMTNELFDPGSVILKVLAVAGFTGVML